MDWIPTISELSGPTFLRVVDALAADIAGGRLARGQRLPTHRALARALGVDLTTVTRAYNEARRRGLIDGYVGRGTFVSETITRSSRSLPYAVNIDLSMNVPPQPVEANLEQRISIGLKAVQNEIGFGAYLNYQSPGGSAMERSVAAAWMAPRLPRIDPARVVIFPGNQSAVFNALLTLTAPGDVVLTENLTFPGVKAAAERLRLRLVGVAMDGGGVIPQELAKACKAFKPKAVYLIPTQHNPTTATLSADRRAEIAEIVRGAKTVLIEDDAYGALEPAHKPIAALIPTFTYHATGLAKCIAPALRVSYLVAPDERAADAMRRSLQATNLMPPPLMVALATHWLKTGTAEAIIRAVRDESRGRQEIARKYLKGIAYAAQKHSHHLWLPLQTQWPKRDVLAELTRRGLGVVSDAAFSAGESETPGIRVSLGAARSRAELAQALEVLAMTLRDSERREQIV